MTQDVPLRSWVKSSYSNQDGGNCVEWSPAHAAAHGTVPVRDSKRPHGPVLLLAPAAWTGLVDLARSPRP
ncbi:DUF397 domain-containing protein [Streptomyces corynorhini]|uniref:DUF397 domain-containing protein n=1 Tax=Streptomyces corynorhini TaxID=2282652 RepID=A0A370B3M2_9ACTN|nr:DUF397 domain-containing protein [Streptomyces corynorhini]RDG36410.1 DUF397 domain-containing protein [Streptomyces corynorhini]